MEVEYIKRMRVYDVVSRAELERNRKGKLIKGRWIDVNKGDSLKPDIRSRYVGKEFATGVDASLYAGTPPLEALKLIIGEAANDQHSGMHIMLSASSGHISTLRRSGDYYMSRFREKTQIGHLTQSGNSTLHCMAHGLLPSFGRSAWQST